MLSIEVARQWYPEEDAVHGFSHILRVYAMAQRLAEMEGADLEIVRVAALLHDAVDPEVGEIRQEHQHAAASFAGRVLAAEGWPAERIEAVQHCIRAHRFRDPSEQPGTLEAQVLFDADKLDAIGAIGVLRAIAYAVQDGQELYTPPSERFLSRYEKESSEPHTPYHEYLYKLQNLKECMYTRSGRALAQVRHAAMATFFEQLQAELKSDR